MRAQLNVTDYIGKQQFLSIIKSSDASVVAVFVAKWCGFCRMFVDLARSVDFRASEGRGEDQSNKKPVYLIDADSDDGSLWDEYKIAIVPTILVFRGDKVVFRQDGRSMVGLVKGDLERAMDAARSSDAR